MDTASRSQAASGPADEPLYDRIVACRVTRCSGREYDRRVKYLRGSQPGKGVRLAWSVEDLTVLGVANALTAAGVAVEQACVMARTAVLDNARTLVADEGTVEFRVDVDRVDARVGRLLAHERPLPAAEVTRRVRAIER